MINNYMDSTASWTVGSEECPSLAVLKKLRKVGMREFFVEGGKFVERGKFSEWGLNCQWCVFFCVFPN